MRILIIAFFVALASILAGLGAEHLQTTLSIIGTFVRLTLSHNPDIAFGIAIPYPLKELLIAVALIAVLFCAFRSKHTPASSLAFGLIIGGAIANLIDRMQDGAVTDFISVGTFPIFNLADACITIGAGILLTGNLVKKKEKSIMDQ